MLKHLPPYGLDLRYISNLSCSLYPFPSTGSLLLFPCTRFENLYSPAFLRPFSLIYVSKLFERIILSCLLFFLESYSIFFPLPQADFCSGWSTLDGILYLFRFISAGCNEPKPSSRIIVVTIAISKTFDSVWYPLLSQAYFGWRPSFFVGLSQPVFFGRRACMVFQNHSF